MLFSDGPTTEEIQESIEGGVNPIGHTQREVIFYGFVWEERPVRWWSWLTKHFQSSVVLRKVELVCSISAMIDHSVNYDQRMVEVLTKKIKNCGEIKITYYPADRIGYSKVPKDCL